MSSWSYISSLLRVSQKPAEDVITHHAIFPTQYPQGRGNQCTLRRDNHNQLAVIWQHGEYTAVCSPRLSPHTTICCWISTTQPYTSVPPSHHRQLRFFFTGRPKPAMAVAHRSKAPTAGYDTMSALHQHTPQHRTFISLAVKRVPVILVEGCSQRKAPRHVRVGNEPPAGLAMNHLQGWP